MKKIRYIGIAILLVCVLSGCQGESESEKNSDSNNNKTSLQQEQNGKKIVPDDSLLMKYFDEDYIFRRCLSERRYRCRVQLEK